MNRYKATIILIIVTIGYLISCPFYKTFWGGLISSGFCASMIGGFADWYGITALFRKPLGVPFKTEIIPRNREKIFDGLSNMVSDELLSREYLKQLLSEYDTSKVILDFLSNDAGRETVSAIVTFITEQSLENLNGNELENATSRLFVGNLIKFNMWNIVISSVEMSVKNGYDDKIIDFFVDELKLIARSHEFNNMLIELIYRAKASYESGSSKRVVVNKVVLDFILNLSSDKIAVAIKEKLEDYLNDIKNEDNEDRLKLKKRLYSKLDNIFEDKDIEVKFEAWKTEQIKNIDIRTYITKIFSDLKGQDAEENKIVRKITNEIDKQVDVFIHNFNDNLNMQKKVDTYVKKAVDKLIDNINDNISKIIRDNLEKYSDDMLVELIESKAGNDLQLIRINGSVVGGLVGILLFLINCI